jgi:hypothetical protein
MGRTLGGRDCARYSRRVAMPKIRWHAVVFWVVLFTLWYTSFFAGWRQRVFCQPTIVDSCVP